MRLPIATKLPLCIGLLLIAVLGGMVWTAYSGVLSLHMATAAERLENLAKQFEEMFSTSFRSRLAAVRQLAADPAIEALTVAHSGARHEAALATLENHARKSNHVRVVEVWHVDGSRLATTGESFPGTISDLVRALHNHAELAPAGTTGLLRDGDQLYFRVVAAVRSDTVVTGYVCEVRKVSGSAQSSEMLSHLLGQDARLIAGSEGGLWTDFSGEVTGPPDGVVSNQDVVQYRRGDASPVLAHLVPVAESHLRLAIEFPLSRLLAPAQSFLKRAAAAALLLTLLGVLGGWWFSRRITRPLEAVTRAAEAIAAGREPHPIATTRHDELGRLESSFGLMATHVQNAQTRLARHAHHYRILFEANPQPMWVLDPASRILEVNRAAIIHYGYERDEFLTMTAADLEATPHAESKNNGTMVVRHRTKHGRCIDVELTRNALGAEPSASVLVLAHDITERLAAARATAEAERQLREKQAHNSAVLGAAIDAIVTMDSRGTVIEFNPAAERLLGWARDEAIGQQMADLIVPPDRRDDHRRGLARYLETGKSRLLGNILELNVLRRDGTEFPAEVSIVRISDHEPPVFTGFIRDQTARRRLESQLRQSQKLEAIGRLAGGIAHDFNNILSVIIGYCDLLTDDGGQNLDNSIAQIRAAGVRAADLTHQLLAFSRQQVMQPRSIDLNRVVTGMDSMLRRLLGEDVQFTVRHARQQLLVFADASQMEQIVMNLVVNARDAMPEGGRLDVMLDAVELDETYAASHEGVNPGHYVALIVSDTGVGMDESVQARIFEPFFTTKPRGKGTGLGLATAFGIVRQSGGSIWVYSEPGAGTTFKIYLPRVVDAGEDAPVATTPTRSLHGTETILLVEDDQHLRELARSILEVHGYCVLDAGDGEAALLQAEQHLGAIDLLLTDVVMPRMSGRELAERLHALRPDLEVLYMSGYTDDAIIRRGVLTADTHFVQKPLTSRSLTTKIRDVLDVQ